MRLLLRTERHLSMRQNGSKSRCGVSLLELLVAIAVIGILASVLLPAISGARETARRNECVSHLRQLGIATSAFESQRGRFPWGAAHKYYLLPFLDHQSIYDAVGPDPSDFPAFWEPISGERIAVYLCPSDSVSEFTGGEKPYSGASYAGCFGSGGLKYGENGVFSVQKSIRARDITDGLSNTVMMSEFRRGNGQMERLRTLWHTPKSYSDPEQFDQFATECDSIPNEPTSYGWQGSAHRGFPWWDCDRGAGLYNHTLTPNRPSCRNGGLPATGIYTAGSLHSGGVNTLYADGHVVFTSDAVDRQVWLSAGSRDELLRAE